MTTKDKYLTVKQQVYQIIKDDICNGIYKPGQQINEVELSTRLSISRSPIRESLRQLVADGLAVEYPNRGVFVKMFTVEEMNDIYEFRVLLEAYAIQQCSKYINKKIINSLEHSRVALQKAYKNYDLKSYLDEDEALHQNIVNMCGNKIVIESYSRVSMMNAQFRIYALTGKVRFDESIAEHEEIIDSIINGNYDHAIEINNIHLEKGKNAISNTL